MGDDDLILSLRAAVERAPDDVSLRLHLAELLLAHGATDEATRHAAHVLSDDPSSESAQSGLRRALTAEPAAGADDPAAIHTPTGDAFDWQRAAADMGDVIPPMFVEGEPCGPDAWESNVRR